MAENRQNQATALASSTPAKDVSNTPSPIVQGRQPEQISIEELIASQESKTIEKLVAPSTSSAQTPTFYIQFGAFAIRANAEATMSSLKSKIAARLPDLDIIEQGSLYRLISGPFNSRSEATTAMVQNGLVFGFKALIVQR